MRFGFIQPALGVFGGTRRILEMANRLVDRGHEVFIYHPEGDRPTWMPCLAEVLACDEIERRPHDVVMFNFPRQLEDARRADAALKMFYILELYETRVLRGAGRVNLLRRRYWRERLLRRCLLGPFTLLSNATWMKRWVEQQLNRPCELVIGGVNRELFSPPQTPGLRRAGRVLTSGDPRPHKGHATVEQAFDRVLRDRPANAPKLELATYHGRGVPQSEMASLYASAEIFVDAQHHAGWNNPVIEAMACGTPVACTAIGGVEDFAFHERTALTVPPRDPDALAQAMTRLLDDPSLRERLRRAALEHVASFTWDRSMDRFLEVVRRHLPDSHEEAATPGPTKPAPA